MPDSYQQRFQSECLKGSAIALDLYDAAIDFVQDSGRWETHAALGRKIRIQWQIYKPHDFGELACLRNEDGSLWQAKPENPEKDSKGKIAKYISGKGAGSRAFLPAIPVRIWLLVAERHGLEAQLPEWVQAEIATGNLEARSSKERSFWAWIEKFPQIEIIITEGGKKALAALSLGYVSISLYGVDGGAPKYDLIAGEKIRKAKPELIPDLQRFAASGRTITLAFDQDASEKSRGRVSAALGNLSFCFEQAGSACRIASWDGQAGQHKGLDDLVVHAGAEAWEQAWQAAVPANQWRIQQKIACQVRRKADFDIGNLEFSEVADLLPKSGLLVLHGGKGTAKSKAIGKMVEERKWLSPTTLISLARDQAAAWGGIFINDGDTCKGRLIQDGSVSANGASVCVPSLMKLRQFAPDALVFDELTALLDFLLVSPLANKDGLRPVLLAEMQRRIQSASLVIAADADLTEEAITWLEQIKGQRACLVKSRRQALAYEAHIIDGKRNQAIAMLMERFGALEEGKLIYINSDAKAIADSLATMLAEQGVKSLLITSASSGGEAESEFLSSKGSLLPELTMQGIRAIISSPSIAQGASIERHTDLIDSVWGFYQGCSIPAHAIAQSMDRVRSESVPRYVHISEKGGAYSKLSRAKNLPAFEREFRQANTAAARLVRHLLTPEALEKSDGIDWQSSNLKMLAALEVRRNQGMADLKDTVIAHLRHEGKRVAILLPEISKKEAKAIGKDMAEAAKSVKQARALALRGAGDISEAEAQALANQSGALSPAEALSLEKFYLAQFYRCEVDVDVVLGDRGGRTRQQIRNLERVLDASLANTHTANTINRSPESPQDWSRAAVRARFLGHAAFTELVGGICRGEIERLEEDAIAKPCEFVRSHPQEAQILFGFRSLEKIGDQQIIGQLLDLIGIKSKRRGKGENARYEICKPELAAILAIVERRKKEVAPPLELEESLGGATSADLPLEWRDSGQLALIRVLHAEGDPLLGVPKAAISLALREVAA